MSANNVVYLNKDTYEVFYQSCADDNDFGKLVKKCKTLKEAVDLAQKVAGEYLVEYGVVIVGKEEK